MYSCVVQQQMYGCNAGDAQTLMHFLCLCNVLGAWLAIVCVQRIQCAARSRSATWPVDAGARVDRSSHTSQVLHRRGRNESIISVFGRRIRSISASVSCDVSVKTLTNVPPVLYINILRRHSLLDQKINNILSVSNDQVVLMAVQSIIQNMLATEDPSQQQLHFLQSCGFGGLWRFAGPFTKVN